MPPTPEKAARNSSSVVVKARLPTKTLVAAMLVDLDMNYSNNTNGAGGDGKGLSISRGHERQELNERFGVDRF